MTEKKRHILQIAALVGSCVAGVGLAVWLVGTRVWSEEQWEQLRHTRELKTVTADAGPRLDTLEMDIEVLQERDVDIYQRIFKTSIRRGEDFLEPELDKETALAKAAHIERLWREILDSARLHRKTLPPMKSPVRGIKTTDVGASTGEYFNPFYKVPSQHGGLDIMAPVGTAVRTPLSGVVTKVQRTEGGFGNMVEITHPGGFVTRYCHLESINVIRRGRVRAGAIVGTVGDSGRAFTTHLHYEVYAGKKQLDPLNCLFASFDPGEYLEMLILSASSGQSMD